MAKRSLIEQLDEAVQAILAHPEASLPRVSPRVAPLLHIAVELRHLPSEEFKARLKADLKRRGLMASRAIAVPKDFRGATPYLSVKDAASAIAFYKKAFGATEVSRLVQPDGRIGHAEIRIGDAAIMLADEFPEMGFRSPQSLGGSPVRIHLYVEDVDALARQAIAAGAKLLRPVEDQFYGDRSGTLVDPFGHTWIIAARKEVVAPAEVQRRFDALLKQPEEGATPREKTPRTVKPVREGFHTITPYLIVQRATELIDFVKQAFGAEELLRGTGSAGGIHAEVRIGDSIVMIGGGGTWRGTPMPTAIHLYVPDADAVYHRALQVGATSIHEPMDQFYGERSAGVKDPSENNWYIATYKGESYVPKGLHSVNIYLQPHGAPQVIDFLKLAFGGEEIERVQSPDGTIPHAKIKIGDSILELGEARGPYQPMPTAIYLYVNDADAVYQSALKAGATSLWAPADQPYGDRNAGVQDPFGNQWFPATHIKDVPL